MKNFKIKLYSSLLRLDMATLKTDGKLKRLFIRKVLKPVGYHFRQKHYNLKYK